MSKLKTRILLVDDHAVVRAGFKLLLAATSAIEVCGEADCGEKAIALYPTLQPDIVVMDLSMPGIGGLETIRRLIQRNENAKILVFSVYNEPIYVNRALISGAQGYITKNSVPDILPEAITHILEGHRYIEAGLLKNNAEQDYPALIADFSAREFDIFHLLAKGLSIHEIANDLCLSHKTVANYATQIKKKLQVSTSAELIRVALQLDTDRPPV
jgi:two-component system invasion response regulator UvrY